MRDSITAAELADDGFLVDEPRAAKDVLAAARALLRTASRPTTNSLTAQVNAGALDRLRAAVDAATPPTCGWSSHVHTEPTICRARAIDGGPCVCTQDPTSPPVPSAPEEGSHG